MILIITKLQFDFALFTGVYGYAGADGRPFAAASVKHGIVVGEASLVRLPGRKSEDGRPHTPGHNKVNAVTALRDTAFAGLSGVPVEGNINVVCCFLCQAARQTI